MTLAVLLLLAHARWPGCWPAARCRSRASGRPACCAACCCRRWSSACCWSSWSARTPRSASSSATSTCPPPTRSWPWSSPRSTSRRRTTCWARRPRSPPSTRGWSSRPALLGDRPRRVFRRVTLPLAAPGLAMALAVAWARAMGAFGAVDHHRLPPVRAAAADLHHAAGDRPGLRAAICPGPAGSRAAAAARRLHLERPCSRPTSRLTAGSSPCARRSSVAPGERLALFGPVRRGQDHAARGHRRAGPAAPRPGGRWPAGC